MALFSVIQPAIAEETYDIFTGLGKQVGDCFDNVHYEECDISIADAYHPKTAQIGNNPPETQFVLFTPTNPDRAEPLHKCGGELPKDTDFDPDVETVLIAHGYLDGLCRTAWQREIKTQLFIRGDYNVILVDWTWGNTPDPGGAAQNSLVAGEQAAFVVQNIMNRTGIKGDKFHLIGHSYGSYLVGIAAKFIKDQNEENMIRRLTFLDPAVAPVSNEDINNGKLSYKNAKFLDVIHSDGGVCFPFNLGLIHPLGHVDFYPNGGSIQPACFEYAIATALRLDLFYGLVSLVPMFCFHLHSIQYFKVSINSPSSKFIGARCDSYEDFKSGACQRCCRDNSTECAVAGMDAEYYYPMDQPREKRKYYFDTEIICPYNEKYDFSIFKDCEDNEDCEDSEEDEGPIEKVGELLL
ncbi:pancreatic lipase-related protein 2-like [Parasteatoda tepidariorum]|uniref:pancreatic lipase-related protein 2-like n=1 Tax=Parasteatoda tepidariorum TaxID=114398 RepID=UPI0039BCFA08